MVIYKLEVVEQYSDQSEELLRDAFEFIQSYHRREFQRRLSVIPTNEADSMIIKGFDWLNTQDFSAIFEGLEGKVRLIGPQDGNRFKSRAEDAYFDWKEAEARECL